MPSDLFEYRPPANSHLPILVSVPHSGVLFPEEDRSDWTREALMAPEDTDWFVDQLYSWAPAAGVGLIKANYSRYTIDLNRDPGGKRLYDDQRQESSLVPSHSFSGAYLYNSADNPKPHTIAKRLVEFYWPYYEEIERHLQDLRRQYPHVMFFDAHSIRRTVPSIQPGRFPDLILGNQDGATAAQPLLATATAALADGYEVSQNTPFKGGHLTRYFGRPAAGIHALQLEMSQDLYLEDSQRFSSAKFAKLKPCLERMLQELAKVLASGAL